MSFKDVKLVWDDTEYVIPANKVLGAIARVEDVITLDELSRFMRKETVPRSRLAQAFGALLRYAGANAVDEDVYVGMFGGDNVSRTEALLNATTALLALMLPPDSVIATSVEEGAGEINPTKKVRRKGSSRGRTKPASGTDG